MTKIIRILVRYGSEVQTIQDEYSPDTFGGLVPAVGDEIVAPSRGLERSPSANREEWTVVRRIFNPQDNDNYIARVG